MTPLWADDSPKVEITRLMSIYNDTSPPLRDIAIRTAPPTGLSLEVPIQVRPGTMDRRPTDQGPDPLRQRDARPYPDAAPTPPPILSVQGLDEDDNLSTVGIAIVPPDTNGDVGFDNYVQWINLVWGVFDKGTGALVGGPFAGNSFFVGFGGFCETTNNGDPIVQFDDNAGRWMVSQFAINQGIQCIAVSTSSDPLGSYHRYAYTVTPGGQNDYPKMGVWDDGTTNSTGQSAYTLTTRDFGVATFIGELVFERDQMLNGLPAQAFKASLVCNGADCREGTLPAHLDGPPVAPGTCPTFFTYYDAAYDDGPSGVDGVRNDRLCVNWAGGSAVWNENAFIPGAPFDRFLGNGFSGCISPVLGGENLACLSLFTMHPAQVRQQDGYCSVVLNTTVDVGGDLGGIRWGELRSNNCETGWTFHQEGTYSPDGNDRWMGSIAMDGDGNIALGYSESSGSMFPAVSYTTRMAGDPLGTMPGGEMNCHAGTGAQVSSAGRWGDYSRMSVDPVNDCTFWYTQEYYETTSSFNFKTRICSFELDGCGEPPSEALFCFSPDNFCDLLEINAVLPDKTVVARWDGTCTGATVPALGGYSGKNVSPRLSWIAGDLFGDTSVISWNFNVDAKTFDLFQHDTAGNLIQFQNDQPYSVTPGACPFASAKPGLPSAVDR
jgi:hypothetical protein